MIDLVKLSTLGLLCIATVAALSRADDFTPPRDGKLTEKQVTTFIAITKVQMDTIRSAGKATAGSQSGAANLAITARASEKVEAAVKDNGMTRGEFDWVSEKVSNLWTVAAVRQQWIDSAKPELEKQITAKESDIAVAKAKQSLYDQCQKDGKRVMTKEQRDAAIASATGDRDGIAGEVKTDQEAIKPISDEIALHQKDAADAEALAKNPPADVSADDRTGYIDGKKNDAQTAKDAAKEAGERLKEAQKNLEDAKARLAAANAKLEHPEVPATEDEKAAVKVENEQAISDARTAVTDAQQAVSLLKETLAAGPLNPNTNDKEKPDPDNLALVQKHIKEYLDAIGAGDMLKNK